MQNRNENIAIVLSVVGCFLFLHDFNNWGKSEIVVNVAATKPTTVIIIITPQLLQIGLIYVCDEMRFLSRFTNQLFFFDLKKISGCFSFFAVTQVLALFLVQAVCWLAGINFNPKHSFPG